MKILGLEGEYFDLVSFGGQTARLKMVGEILAKLQDETATGNNLFWDKNQNDKQDSLKLKFF